MSSKAGSKMKRSNSVSKKKGAFTPEHSTAAGTPTASVDSMGPGGGGGGGEAIEENSVDAVLQGPDIEVLRIREEDLQKLHVPKPPSSAKLSHTRRVMVRREYLPPDPTHPTSLKQRNVAILRPLPPGATPTTTLLGSPRAGPRFEEEGGSFVPHSILGSSEEFSSELKNRGMISSTSTFTQPPPITPLKRDQERKEEGMSYEETIVPRETHALQQWETSMQDRRRQQAYLSGKLQLSPDRLLMNHGDSYRTVQEERTLIDRGIPSVNYGKGYRVGSEFWSQEPRIGDELTGISSTLTRTERGLPPELEYVSVPTAIRREKGVDFGSERNAPLHHTWQSAPYISRQLATTPREAETFRPDVSELQVIGHNPGHAPTPGHAHQGRAWLDSLDSEGELEAISTDDEEEEEESEGDPSAPAKSPAHQPLVVGPALSVGGHMLTWEGPPQRQVTIVEPMTECEGVREWSVPVELRVLFEMGVGEEDTSHLPMKNCGTTAVYYSWQPLVKPNPLGTVQSGEVQRFYFDSRGGTLLPGESLAFPFVFKSPNAGVFSEVWGLQTGPVLARGRPLRVVLRGVALQDDLNAGKRMEIERMLTHRMAEAAAGRLVNRLVASIGSPPRTPVPFKTSVMEEDVFLEKNPGVFHHHSVVQQLKRLYDEVVRPDLLEDAAPEPSKVAKKEKDDKGTKKGRASREKKEAADSKGKNRAPTTPAPTVSEEPHPPVDGEGEEVAQKQEAPEWDLSLSSLRDVIMAVEDDASREEKLARLTELAGALSFPPPRPVMGRRHNVCYEALCELVDGIAGVSAHLCKLMGMPVREMASSKLAEDEEELSAVPSSPVAGGKKDKEKKGGKEAKKGGDAKQKAGKERAPSRGKAAPGKKAKQTASSKEEIVEASPEVAPTPVKVDPQTEQMYRERLHIAVYGLLSSTVEKMSVLFEDLA